VFQEVPALTGPDALKLFARDPMAAVLRHPSGSATDGGRNQFTCKAM